MEKRHLTSYEKDKYLKILNNMIYQTAPVPWCESLINTFISRLDTLEISIDTRDDVLLGMLMRPSVGIE